MKIFFKGKLNGFKMVVVVVYRGNSGDTEKEALFLGRLPSNQRNRGSEGSLGSLESHFCCRVISIWICWMWRMQRKDGAGNDPGVGSLV